MDAKSKPQEDCFRIFMCCFGCIFFPLPGEPGLLTSLVDAYLLFAFLRCSLAVMRFDWLLSVILKAL